jgi:hypothetical protein
MGDDCVEAHSGRLGHVLPEDVAMGYARFGVVLTDVCANPLSEGLEFCSHRFDGAGAIPVAPDKQVASLLYKKPTDQESAHALIAALSMNLRHHPEGTDIVEVICDAGWGGARISKEEALAYIRAFASDGEEKQG